MSEPQPRVLLVCPPWQSAFLPSLALATLRPLLDAAGIACDELHCSTLFPVMPVLSNRQTLLERVSGFLFAPLLHPGIDQDQLVERILESYRDSRNLGGILYSQETLEERQAARTQPLFVYDLKRGFEAARVCIDRCVAKVSERDCEYDVIGMSVTFENQIPAALALAHRFKARWPATRIVLGGAACAGEQSDGILASFPVIDVVCRTEGESVIVPLIRALRGELPLAQVPGIAYRHPDGTPASTPSPKLLMDLDTLPIPTFSAFLEQYQASEWAPLAQAHLIFETSRGCWYGEKHLCSFCGLNGEGLAYRRKSTQRAFDEIVALYRTPGTSGFLEATDNILAMEYYKELLPRLAALPQDPGRPLELFFEIKSNLKREQVHTLVRGHVVAVQPGIESFSDEILELMDKGCTAAGQVQFLKWIDESGIKPTYNILMRNPGEKAAWYREMEALLPYIRHLPPPTGLTPMHLERFSPYHTKAEAFGITNVRPQAYYADMYPNQQIDERAAYTFAYDHEMLSDQELIEAQRSFALKVVTWQGQWKPGTLFYIDKVSHLELHDRRPGVKQVVMMSGVGADVFRYLNSARPPAALKQQFASVDPALIDGLVAVWRRRQWLCTISGRLLAVVPEHFPYGLGKRIPSPKAGPKPVEQQASAGM